MKAIVSLALAACTAVLITACGGTKGTAPATAVAPSAGEFDPSSGGWVPLKKVVAPPPHQQGAVIAEQKKPGVMDKVGKTLKKPLQWVGLSKEGLPEASPTVPAAAAAAPAKKETAKPPQ